MPRLPLPAGLLAGLILILTLLGTTPAVAATEQAAVSRLTIYVSSCPPGYAGTAYYQDCGATPQPGVGFTVYGGDGPASTATTGVDGVAAVEGFAGGPYPRAVFVEAAVPLDLAGSAVFCYDEAGALPVTHGGTGITLEAADGYVQVHCDWFVVPAGGGQEPPGTASLTVRKWACPVGFDWQDFAACRATPLGGVAFAVKGATGASDAAGTTDEYGTVGFLLQPADLPGNVGVVEDVPAGFGGFAVACFDADGATIEHVETDVGTVTLLGVKPGDQVGCDWYNVRAEQPTDQGSITVYKAVCPAGYAGDDYYGDCYGTPGAGVDFATSIVGTHVGVGDSTDEAGLVTLPLLLDDSTGPGTVRLAETADPKGDQQPPAVERIAVVCTKNGGDRVDVANEGSLAVLFEAEPGDEVRCDWFNVQPAEEPSGGSVAIRFRLCPPGYGGESYANACQQVPADAPTFYADTGESATPDAEGLAVFPTLRGSVTIYQGATGDYRAVAVCSDGPDVLSFESAGTGEITLEVAAGDEIVCDWYHINPAPLSGLGDAGTAVVRLPDTGTGASDPTPATGADALAAALATIGALTLLGVLATVRRGGVRPRGGACSE